MTAQTRRRFVVRTLPAAIVAGVLAAFFGRGFAARETAVRGPSGPGVDPRALVRAYFRGGDLTSVTAIGAAYRQGLPAETLLSDVEELLGGVAGYSDLGSAVAALRAAVMADFDAVRLTSVGGWQLAPSEARLCALADVIGI